MADKLVLKYQKKAQELPVGIQVAFNVTPHRDGSTMTTCAIIVENTVVARGISIKSPKDCYKRAIGMDIAWCRAERAYLAQKSSYLAPVDKDKNNGMLQGNKGEFLCEYVPA